MISTSSDLVPPVGGGRFDAIFSRVFVAVKDRGKFLFFNLPKLLVSFSIELSAVRAKFPDAPMRIHFVSADWGIRRVLAFTRAFKVPLRTIPSLPIQSRAVEAFLAGEPAISRFFASSPGQDEKQRRAKMPELLRANPEDFVLLVAVTPGGTLRLCDGAHRLALAKKRGLSEVWVKLVWAGGQDTLILHPNPRPFFSWLLLPFKRSPH